ncbi:unnamed protein product, partial [Cladocopium goreaui]
LQEQKAKPAELGPLRPPWVAATLVTTGKGGKEQKGQHRGKGETRQRSAAAVERRILRGAARRAEAWLRSEEGEEAGQCKRPRREELDYVEALRLQSVPESAVPEFLDERSYALEEGGRRVAQGIVGEADQRARRAQPGVRTEAGEEAEEEEEERTLLGDGDETVDEEEAATVFDDNETHFPEEFQTILPDEDSETEWETAESSSVAASEVARAVRDLDLRSEKAKEEVKEKEEEQAPLVREATGRATAGLGLKGGILATAGITEGGAEAAGEAQIAQLQEQQNRLLEGLRRANAGYESQAARLNETVWRRLVKLTEPAYRTKEEKISILAHVAPAELQQSIFMHSDALDTYAKIRDYIEQYLINKNVWKRPQGSQFGLTKVANKTDDGGPMPMDIGAVLVSAVSADDEFTYLLVDSGACENVAKHGEFQDPINTSLGKPLFGVQGNPLTVYGKQFPRVEVGNLKGCMSMTVTDSAESLLSVYNLVDKGHKVHFEQGNCYMITSTNEKVPLELHGKRWYLKVNQNKQEDASSTSSSGATRRVAAMRGVRVEEEREPDTWKMESNEDGDFVIRVHNTPRFQLFNPERVDDLPVDIAKLKPGRLTKMYFTEDGSHETNEREGDKVEAEKVEGLVNPEQDMDDFFMDWIMDDPEDGMDRKEKEAEEIREQRQLQEKGGDEHVKEPDVPVAPSQEAREKHMLHHANFEPWCEVCVQGQGRDAPHRKQKEDKKQHIIYSDYMFFSTSGNEVGKEEGMKQKGLITVLTAICKDSQYPFAMVVPAKGGGYYARDALANWIRELGWEKVVIQTDKEKIGTDHYMFPWVVRHSAWTLARFHINKTKTTAFQVIKGREYISELMPLGETVMGKYPKVKDKAAPRWVKGIYAGKTESSDEHLVLTSSGALTFRTVRRLPKGSQFQNAVMDAARGAPWNTVLGSDRAKPDPVRSELKLKMVPELGAQETYEFEEGEEKEQGSLPAVVGKSSVVPAPVTPAVAPSPNTPKVKSGSAPGTPRCRTGTRSAPGTPRNQSPQKAQKTEPGEAPKAMKVDAEGESISIEEKEAKKQRVSEESTSANPAGDTAMLHRAPQVFRIDTPPEAAMSDAAQDVVSSIGEGIVLEPDKLKERHKVFSNEDYRYFKKWLEERKDNFETETVANIMDYLDTLGPEGEERKLARKAELKKLNESFEAFTPRDRRALPKEIIVFGHKWVDKVSEGVAKSRLTCQDFKRRGQKEDKNSSEAPSNFCPTPFAASRKILEVYSMSTGMPRCKADLTSAFLIAADQGDRTGQPVMMKPPEEWLEEYDEWLLLQSKEVQEELKDVPKSEIVWQVNGNLYGRQSAAAQYRDRLDTIVTKELPKDKYEFTRGQIDACVYKCKKTGTVLLLHHIDDFDICGPEEVIQDLLMIQLPRTKISVEEAVITKPNAKHINTILTQLGLENAKPGPVPGKKLQLERDKLLDEKQKAIFASCVGSAIYLSQDRPDIKFSVKELAKRIREPRECDMINLKVLGRYLKGTVNYGHVTKVAEGLYIKEGLPLHSYCDSDWAGDVETRRSTSGEAIFLGEMVKVGTERIGLVDLTAEHDVYYISKYGERVHSTDKC